MKVRSVGVRRVWDCMLCACVSEEGGDGEGADSETPSLMSYILRYISLAELGTLCRVGLRDPMHLCTYVSEGHTVPGWVAGSDAPVYMRERGGWGRGGCGFRNTISAFIHT